MSSLWTKRLSAVAAITTVVVACVVLAPSLVIATRNFLECDLHFVISAFVLPVFVTAMMDAYRGEGLQLSRAYVIGLAGVARSTYRVLCALVPYGHHMIDGLADWLEVRAPIRPLRHDDEAFQRLVSSWTPADLKRRQSEEMQP